MIMNKLKNELYKKGYNNLIRVHDALYGIDEINKDTIDDILYNIVFSIVRDTLGIVGIVFYTFYKKIK